MKTNLKSSEWLLIGSLFLIMASLVLIAQVNAFRASSAILDKDLRQEKVLVTVEGAVRKPGEYSVVVGSLVEEVVRKAGLKPNANVKALPFKEIVEGPLKLVVEELTEIVVQVRGAVQEEVELTLPVKSRICDLKSKIILTDEAEKAFFRRRRALKNGEIIEVPKKTVE